MRRKLGLFTEEPQDELLIETLLAWMLKTKADFTNTFAALAPEMRTDPSVRDDAEFLQWHTDWQARLRRQPQAAAEAEALRRANNPAFIPRNHHVEAALGAANQGDLRTMERLLEILAAPYDHTRDAPEYRFAHGAGSADYRTFCGT